jgi:uncharacterized membrane protein YfcA
MLLPGLAVTFAAGVTLGLLGGGGSVLVVPVLVAQLPAVGARGGVLVCPALTQVLHVPVERAVAASLVMVAAQSLAGALRAIPSLPAFDFHLVVMLTATMLLR